MTTAAQLLVKCLEAHDVKYVFGIPGAKIDSVFNALCDSSIKLIVCRHEQNAAFMAAAYGRLTGKPGVVLVTSGPGVANLTTGLLTATTEGDPVVAFGGNVPRAMQLKESHQNTQNVKLMEAVTKSSAEVVTADTLPEVVENAFRHALMLKRGATFVSLPQDVLSEKTTLTAIKPIPKIKYGAAPLETIQTVAQLIQSAKCPVLLFGEESSRPENTKAIRELLIKTPLPVTVTFQAAGVMSHAMQDGFLGRVGLFKNQPGDALLDQADLIVTIGFNPGEYDPEIWNQAANKKIVHVASMPADIRLAYQPTYELIGDITETLKVLSAQLPMKSYLSGITEVKRLHDDLYRKIESGKHLNGTPIHPLRFIYELRTAITDDTLVACDVGSIYMWMARYFLVYHPHQLLFSNGQQTLGVALPWAMAGRLADSKRPIVSMSGDGGFLFSAMELETAVREKLKFIHFIWTDGTYNMVLEQEVMKYHRKSGVDLGKVDVVKFAEAFGATGFELTNADQFAEIYKKAMAAPGPVLINVPIDYSHNMELFVGANPYEGN